MKHKNETIHLFNIFGIFFRVVSCFFLSLSIILSLSFSLAISFFLYLQFQSPPLFHSHCSERTAFVAYLLYTLSLIADGISFFYNNAKFSIIKKWKFLLLSSFLQIIIEPYYGMKSFRCFSLIIRLSYKW